MKTTLERFINCRNVGVPIIAIATPDALETITSIASGAAMFNHQIEGKVHAPMIQWDSMNGWRHMNKAGKAAMEKVLGAESDSQTKGLPQQIALAARLPEGSILFIHNSHRFLKDQFLFTQGLWNLRDQYSGTYRTVVLLGPSFNFPVELQQDVLVIEEPLPNDERLKEIVERTLSAANILEPDPEQVIAKAVNALRGLAAFPAEQAASLSAIYEERLDIDELWERKKQMISETPGLSVSHDGITFDDLGGLEHIKMRARRIINGRLPFRCVVWIDEGEKQMAGADRQGDSNGINKDQHGVLLNEMQVKHHTGLIAIGITGTGKSAFANALGNEAGVPTVKLDLGEMKGSLVGESERKIRHAMKVIDAISGGGGAFFVMTSNDISCIKPEMRRRFRKNIWFFDLPTPEERLIIWSIYLRKYKITDSHSDIDDAHWTAAEIENCVTNAWEERISIKQSASEIIPVALSSEQEIKDMRKAARGKFSSPSYPGAYKEAPWEEEKPIIVGRKFSSKKVN